VYAFRGRKWRSSAAVVARVQNVMRRRVPVGRVWRCRAPRKVPVSEPQRRNFSGGVGRVRALQRAMLQRKKVEASGGNERCIKIVGRIVAPGNAVPRKTP